MYFQIATLLDKTLQNPIRSYLLRIDRINRSSNLPFSKQDNN